MWDDRVAGRLQSGSSGGVASFGDGARRLPFVLRLAGRGGPSAALEPRAGFGSAGPSVQPGGTPIRGMHEGQEAHYSRRTRDSKTFTGVGQEVVLVTRCGRAVWACVYQRTPSKPGTGASRGRTGQTDAKPRYLWRNMRGGKVFHAYPVDTPEPGARLRVEKRPASALTLPALARPLGGPT